MTTRGFELQSSCIRSSYLIHQAIGPYSCYIIDFIVHVSSHFLHSTLHCSCFISFPLIHFIDHVSFLFPLVHSPSHSFHLPQSISIIFTLSGCTHITWSFNLIVSFTFQSIPSLEINDLECFQIIFQSQIDIHYVKLNSGGFTTPCLFILNKKYSNCLDCQKYFVCKRFTVKTFLCSLKFVIQIYLKHNNIKIFVKKYPDNCLVLPVQERYKT